MKIAVIGAGISGLGCAWALSSIHDVVLIEKQPQVGGHSRTLDVPIGENGAEIQEGVKSTQTIPVDTGFIVFNRENYPDLTALFTHLNVPIAKSSMSFGVSQGKGSFEYGTHGLKAVFGQCKNLIRPSFWRMLLDIKKFNKDAQRLAREEQTMRELVNEMGLSNSFRDRYLIPMGASIWSTPSDQILDYPAKSFLRFFDNHGLLDISGGPQWYTVEGGSREYVNRLLAEFKGEIRTGITINSVQRDDHKVHLTYSDGTKEVFDQVVFACHADQTKALINDASDQESTFLSHFTYRKNTLVTHTDTSFMPTRRQCWSSWVYLNSDKKSGVSLTYWMNNLQPLPTEKPILVTMNPAEPVAENSVEDEWVTEHPIFDTNAVNAQHQLSDVQGQNMTYFCGAWTGYGFHEDGLRSGLDVAEHLGAKIPWREANA